jgi:hypothetical protein
MGPLIPANFFAEITASVTVSSLATMQNVGGGRKSGRREKIFCNHRRPLVKFDLAADVKCGFARHVPDVYEPFTLVWLDVTVSGQVCWFDRFPLFSKANRLFSRTERFVREMLI